MRITNILPYPVWVGSRNQLVVSLAHSRAAE